MKKFITIAALLTVTISGFASTQSIAPMLAKVQPAIVNVFVKKEIPLPDETGLTSNKPKVTDAGVGSGVIINAKSGLIVTNAHVVKDQKLMVVTLKDGRRFHAKEIAESDDYDLAVIQIKAKHLHKLDFADSNKLKVGDFVAAIGSPFGLKQTVTTGIVSALSRSIFSFKNPETYVQTDAPINPGNSGGALINAQGKLVGINSAIVSNTGSSVGIGFSIPSNTVKAVAMQLLKYGNVKKGMLGVLVQNIDPNLASELKVKANTGVLVSQVVPNSPASKAGFKVGDVILKAGNEIVNTNDALRSITSLTRPDTKLSFVVERDGKQRTLSATIGDPDKIQSSDQLTLLQGLQLRNFNQLMGDGTTLRGVQIVDEKPSSSAALASLQPGDVIISINAKRVYTIKQLRELVNHKQSVLVYAARGTKRFYASLQ